MIKLFLFAFLLLSNLSYTQPNIEVDYYDELDSTIDSGWTKYIDYFVYTNSINYSGKIITKTTKGQIRSEIEYSDIKARISDGQSKTFYENGRLETSVNYSNGKINGDMTIFDESGNPGSQSSFKKAKF